MEDNFPLYTINHVFALLSLEAAVPISAKDISDDLLKEFAFLSGEYGALLPSRFPCKVIKYPE